VHMMFPELELAYHLLDEFPGLYLDATNVFAAFRPEYRPMIDAAGNADQLRETFIDGLCCHKGRVMFGSDHPAGMGSLEQIYADMRNFGLPQDVIKSLVADAPISFVRKFVPDFSFEKTLSENPA